jgi:EAL domain-containing protein (putative c-di-GMP-specific phosphodiesterase class I)
LQSQVDAAGTLVGAEALVRWRHPTRGLISPASFIPLAEESRLIVPLGEWVLRQACEVIAQLDAAGHSLHIAVNVSPRQFQQPNFVLRVKEILSLTGADPTHLTLEITEGLLVDHVIETMGRMAELAALGIRFSIDDFGTGYSSLAYLKRLPLFELKIDKSFVQDIPTDPNDVALVETILAMSRHLHLQVVAEGVETAAQFEFLKAQGCERFQGYYFHRPQPQAAWLAQRV